MTSSDRLSVRERFGLALDLFDLAERMLRQKLKRTHPEASGAEIDARDVDVAVVVASDAEAVVTELGGSSNAEP